MRGRPLKPRKPKQLFSVFSQPEADERSYIEEVLSKTRLRGYFVTPPADTVFQDMEQYCGTRRNLTVH
jgi:hypothetical protein